MVRQIIVLFGITRENHKRDGTPSCDCCCYYVMAMKLLPQAPAVSLNETAANNMRAYSIQHNLWHTASEGVM